MNKLVCPRCGSSLRKSHTVGFKEKLLKISGSRAFRCRDKQCNWRGFIKTKSVKDSIMETYGQYVVILVFAIIFITICMAAIYYIYGTLDKK